MELISQQADQPFDHPRQRNGLSDLLAALEGAQLGGAGAKNGNGGNAAQGNGAHEGQGEKGNGGDQGGRQGGQADSKTVTVTEQAQQAASNQTCEAIKTVTKTVSVPGVAAVGTGYGFYLMSTTRMLNGIVVFNCPSSQKPHLRLAQHQRSQLLHWLSLSLKWLLSQ